jgi:hypothetical protein
MGLLELPHGRLEVEAGPDDPAAGDERLISSGSVVLLIARSISRASSRSFMGASLRVGFASRCVGLTYIGMRDTLIAGFFMR